MSQTNPPPRFARFCADDEEIIQEFLKPKIEGVANSGVCLIEDGVLIRDVLSGSVGEWSTERYPYFRKGHYWLFVEQGSVKRGQKMVPIRKEVRADGATMGIWKPNPGAKHRIQDKSGGQVFGYKQKLGGFIKILRI